MDMPSLYTPNQVADYLHVSRGTIYSLISRNEIDSIKVGRNRRFTAQQVKEYLSRRGQQIVVVQQSYLATNKLFVQALKGESDLASYGFCNKQQVNLTRNFLLKIQYTKSMWKPDHTARIMLLI